MQYNSAYFFKELTALFSDEKDKNAVENLIKQLAHFELVTDKDLNVSQKENSLISIANNALFSNLVNEPSNYILNFFKEKLSILNTNSKINIFNKNEELKDLIYRSLHIISPENNSKEQLEILNSKAEFAKSGINEDLIYSILPSYLGEEILQLIEKEKDFLSIIKYSENKYIIKETKYEFPAFAKYNLNLSIQNPVNKTGISIQTTQIKKENETLSQRDRRIYSEKIFQLADWHEAVSITQSHKENIKQEIKGIEEFIASNKEYFDIVRQNFDNPIYNSGLGLEALQLTISPVAIARIQKTILKYIQANILKLDVNEWNISVVERDLPCAHIAIEDFKIKLNAILKLQNAQLPRINLVVYGSEISKKSKLNAGISVKEIRSINFKEKADLLIDISVLKRKEIQTKKLLSLAKNTAIIRSSYSTNSTQEFHLNETLDFQNINNQDIAILENSHIPENKKSEKYINSIVQSAKENMLFVNLSSENKEKIVHFYAKYSGGLVLYISDIEKMESHKFSSELNFHSDNFTEIEKKRQLEQLINNQFLSCRVSYKDSLSVEFNNALNEFVKNKGKISFVFFDNANEISEWNYNFKPLNYFSLIQKINFVNKHNQQTKLIAFSNSVSYDSEEELKSLFSVTAERFFGEKNTTEINEILKKTRSFSDYRNKEKEKQVLDELLFNISSHKRKNEDLILSIVEKKAGKKLSFEYIPKAFPYILQVEAQNGVVGEIDFSTNGNIKVHEAQNKKYKSFQLLEFIETKIKENKDKKIDTFEWLKQSRIASHSTGFDNNLEKVNHYFDFTMKIPFRNEIYNEIESLLRVLSDKFTSNFILEASNTHKVSRFIQKIEKIHKLDSEKLKLELEKLFVQLRSFDDTLLALYRLSSIGMIDFIKLNYGNEIIEVELKKQNKQLALEKLNKQINSLKTSRNSTIGIKEISKTEGSSFLSKSLNFYTNFIYSEFVPIVRQNLLSLSNAERLKTREANKQTFKDYKQDFFRSKYANPNNVPNLIFDTEGFTNNDFRIVHKYINECRHNTDNLLHLKYSTLKLKDVSGGNLVIKILHAYADLITSETENENSVHVIFDELMNFYTEFGIAFSELYKISDKFLDKLYSRKYELHDYIEPVKDLKLNSGWLQNFNKKFLKNYSTTTLQSCEIQKTDTALESCSTLKLWN